MTETLLSMSEVLLYGKTVTDMKYKDQEAGCDRHLVRVYGFGFEGGYYAMEVPIIMLLKGEGSALAESTPKDVKNSFSSELKQWQCDKSDHSARLDEMTGTIEEILLEVEIDGGGPGSHVSGGRVNGGRVSGGRVSGGRVSGGRVSGGRVSGAKHD